MGDLGQKDSLEACEGGRWGRSSPSHVLQCPAAWMAVG